MGRLKKGISNNSGVALLLVVSVISLLLVVILQFNRGMRNNLVHSHHFKSREQLFEIAESGINLGLAVLHYDSYYNDYDCPHDNWAKIDQHMITDLGGGSEVTVTIKDLSGKFQLNSLVAVADNNSDNSDSNRMSPDDAREILVRLLVSGNFIVEDELQAREIADSITDWLDSDDQESEYGVESSYYESLEKPYVARNGFMESSHELLDVKGISYELLYGNDEKAGLADYISVFGTDSKININTADEVVISSLHNDLERDEVELLTEFRAKEDNAGLLADKTWYKTVAGWPAGLEFDNTMVTTSSTFFSVTAVAYLAEMKMTMTAIVKRTGKKKLEIIYRKAE